MSKVVLTNPPTEASKERQFARTREPRLGLAYLAAYLERQGVQTEVIDAKFEGLSFSQVVDRGKKQTPDLVGITAFTPDIVDAARLATDLKRELPHTPVVIGGAHATALPVQTMEQFHCFDFLIYGEGEITLNELVLALSGKKAMEDVRGLVFRSKEIKQNEPRPLITNLDELPFPAWHLFPPLRQYPVLSSRGCPFKCVFCSRVLGNKLRLRSAQNIIDELQSIYDNYHPERISFHDDTFGINHRHTYELLDLIIKSGLSKKVKFDVTTRVDTVNYELLKKLKEAGFTAVGLGIESGNQQILNNIGKGITLEQSEKAAAAAKKAGVHTNAFFILGHPNETRETIRDTIKFAAKLDTTRVNFGIMVPYPGTEVARLAEKGEGNYRLLSNNWADYGKQVGAALEMRDISRRELERLQLRGYIEFQLHNISLSKLRRFFRDLSFSAIVGYLTEVLPRGLSIGRGKSKIEKRVLPDE